MSPIKNAHGVAFGNPSKDPVKASSHTESLFNELGERRVRAIMPWVESHRLSLCDGRSPMIELPSPTDGLSHS